MGLWFIYVKFMFLIIRFIGSANGEADKVLLSDFWVKSTFSWFIIFKNQPKVLCIFKNKKNFWLIFLSQNKKYFRLAFKVKSTFSWFLRKKYFAANFQEENIGKLRNFWRYFEKKNFFFVVLYKKSTFLPIASKKKVLPFQFFEKQCILYQFSPEKYLFVDLYNESTIFPIFSRKKCFVVSRTNKRPSLSVYREESTCFMIFIKNSINGRSLGSKLLRVNFQQRSTFCSSLANKSPFFRFSTIKYFLPKLELPYFRSDFSKIVLFVDLLPKKVLLAEKFRLL